MIRTYIKIAFRNLFRQKLFSFINIFGLALSMSICLPVIMRIKHQLSYDKFHPHTNRTYRITTAITNRQGASYQFASTPLPLATTLVSKYNLAEKYVRLYPAGSQIVSTGKKKLPVNITFTDPGFFDVFGFTLLYGNPQSAFTNPNSIVLSKKTAEKLFGAENPVGRILSFDKLGSFHITGILDNPAGKSHIDFEAYASMNSVPLLEKSGMLTENLEKWNNGTVGYTYILLKQATGQQQLANAVTDISRELVKQTKTVGKENFAFNVQPLNKIILGEEMLYSIGNTGSPGKVITEIVIAFIILLLACFNYTNLSVARSLNRSKEVGIRKVSGAVRYQVFMQFIIEAVVTSLLSLALAYIMMQLMVDYLPGTEGLLPPDVSPDITLFIWFLLFSLFTGLLAGALPAWALSSFKPVEVLKNLTNIKLFGGNGFRKGLIVIQFALSLVIIIFTQVFSRQFQYMATADPGFSREHIMSIPLQGTGYQLLAHDIEQLQGVVRVSATSKNLGRGPTGTNRVKMKPGDEPIGIGYYHVDHNFIANMNLVLLAGNTFTENTEKEKYVIINEKTLEVLKITSPADAIGKPLLLDDTLQVQVAGVIKNIFFSGMEINPGPLLLRNRPQEFQFLNIRTADEQPAMLVKNIEAIWNKYNPQGTFTWSWLKDDLYERQSARSMVSTLGFLAFMAVTIACLGLLGMVVYTTETRRREISIRKVMGASVAAIISLLSKNFLKLVIIAGFIALPVSYLMGYFFLNMFANRITISPLLLLLSFLGIIVLALLTIGTQIFKVATENPVKSLRTE